MRSVPENVKTITDTAYATSILKNAHNFRRPSPRVEYARAHQAGGSRGGGPRPPPLPGGQPGDEEKGR